MKNVLLKYGICVLSLFTVNDTLHSQANCKDIDLAKIPGKWVWESNNGDGLPTPSGSWQTCGPLRKELQRIMPQPVDGIISTNYISPTGAASYFNTTKFPSSYTNTVMVKDYECIMYPNAIVQPEGATGCWIYFTVNYWSSSTSLPGNNEITYTEYPSNLYLTDIWFETDANGNQSMYSSTDNKETAVFQSYFFMPKKRLPFRKLTRKELFDCYKVFHESRLNKKIANYEKAVTKEQADYNDLSAAEKKAQAYRLDVMVNTKKILSGYKTEKDKMLNWYSTVIMQSNINDTAYAEQIVSWNFEPEKLDARPGKGNPVWIQDISFYDRTKPANQPQCIFLYFRRQDQDAVKKNFIDKFCSEFNLDVLAKMVGDTPKKPGGINSISGSVNDAKQETKLNQGNVTSYSYNFENTNSGSFPSGWLGMNNISVQIYRGATWLSMTKEGYWYLRQFNKEIKDGFNLSFDLTWNPEISYYSGLFTVTLSEMEYDNVREQYKSDYNQRNYNSFYDNYAANFNRVILWFDPYWNGGGSLTVYSYYAGGALAFKKQVVLPDFYREKNKHQLQVQRKGNSLVVTDNGKAIASFADVFLKGARYNLHTFSRYKANNGDKSDVFYVKDIKVNY